MGKPQSFRAWASVGDSSSTACPSSLCWMFLKTHNSKSVKYKKIQNIASTREWVKVWLLLQRHCRHFAQAKVHDSSMFLNWQFENTDQSTFPAQQFRIIIIKNCRGQSQSYKTSDNHDQEIAKRNDRLIETKQGKIGKGQRKVATLGWLDNIWNLVCLESLSFVSLLSYGDISSVVIGEMITLFTLMSSKWCYLHHFEEVICYLCMCSLYSVHCNNKCMIFTV